MKGVFPCIFNCYLFGFLATGLYPTGLKSLTTRAEVLRIPKGDMGMTGRGGRFIKFEKLPIISKKIEITPQNNNIGDDL